MAVSITYGGVDITTNVVFEKTSFEAQLAAQPGQCEIVVRDRSQIYSFVTGKEISASIDGTKLYGGYGMAIEIYYATIVDTRNPAGVTVRHWRIRGVDYNILFDRRVLANYASLASEIPQVAAGSNLHDGDAIKSMCTNYLDLSGDGLDTSTLVANVDVVQTGSNAFAYGAPGDSWRQAMERISNKTGSLWYIRPDKKLVNAARETATLSWGFSDNPNHSTTYGARELSYTSDGSQVVNDALVWGGSYFGSASTVFGRVTNAASVSSGLRMQYPETHFNETGFFFASDCIRRGNIIVYGDPGAVSGDPNRGLQYPQQLVRATWFHDRVPSLIAPGTVMTFTFAVFGGLTVALPLRQLRISFATKSVPKLEGFFGIQIGDPYSLWTYMRQVLTAASSTTSTISAASSSSTTAQSGQFFSAALSPAPDGSTKTFTLKFPYVSNSTNVYKNGIHMTQGASFDYTESAPGSAQITFAVAPSPGDQLWGSAYAA